MVTQYCSRGLGALVGDDGRLPWPEADIWRRRNVVSVLSGSWAYRQAQKQWEHAGNAHGNVPEPGDSGPAASFSKLARPGEAQAYRRLLERLYEEAGRITGVLIHLGLRDVGLLSAAPEILVLIMGHYLESFEDLAFPDSDLPEIECRTDLEAFANANKIGVERTEWEATSEQIFMEVSEFLRAENHARG